jgi:hypothetical protein
LAGQSQRLLAVALQLRTKGADVMIAQFQAIATALLSASIAGME